MLLTNRNIVTMILLFLFTCGIYPIYWIISVQDELQRNYTREQLKSGIMVVLLMVVTCGIYSFFWLYKTAQVINELSEDAGLGNPRDEVLMLILGAFTFFIIFAVLMQDRINKITEAN